MRFGPVPPTNVPQQDSAKVMLLAERWQRASFAHARWAEPAKRCIDFLEGRHWTEKQIAELASAGRPSFKFNVIAPVVRLVLGYQRNNKVDTTFKPGQDTRASKDTADALSKLFKVIAENSAMEFVDAEVFLDGLTCARGWFRTVLDWTNNDLGEVVTKAGDPFQVFPDPDCDTYNLNESASFIQTSKFVSMDEIEVTFGKHVKDLIKPWTSGQTPLAPISSIIVADQLSPVRTFGMREDTQTDFWDDFYSLMGDFVDTYRKTIRIIETEYKVTEPRNVVIDLETGDKKTLPEDWGRDKIEKILLYAEQVGNPCVVQRRMVERLHWTTIIGDLIVYDKPSFYDAFTYTGYFPYFRRGMTRGMVEDLIDPQLEKNKRRNARIEIEARTANGGWLHHATAFNPVQKAKLEKFGSTPGVDLEWQGAIKPEQIQPSQPATGQQRLEADADEDIRRISGINESALGEHDSATSGRAIEARQRQAVLSVQLYMDNFRRSRQLVGARTLELIQNNYTEQRIYRVTGADGKLDQFAINQMLQDPVSGAKKILLDVTLGKYSVVIDETPMAATFESAQFDEMMSLLEKMGPALGPQLPMFADLIIGMSSMPRKEDWIERFQMLMGQQQQPQPGAQPQPGQPGQPQPGAQPQQALPPPVAQPQPQVAAV